MKICVSVMAENVQAAKAKMKKAFSLADMVELRIDRIGSEKLDALLQSKEGTILITNRKKEEGGFFKGSEEERIAVLKRAVSLGVDIVDIELSSGEAVISEIACHIKDAGARTKLLVSYHNFNGTPSDRLLRNKAEACARAGGDMIKIVTLADSMDDNLRILKLIPDCQKKGYDVVAFCMGDAGRISRVAAPLFGAPFTFASLEKGSESAPGQMTVQELKSIFELLQGK